MHSKLHFYYCAYLSLRLAAIYDKQVKPEDKTLHLIQWMNNTRRNRTFDCKCDSEIQWLHSVIKKYGMHVDVEKLVLHVYTTSVSLLTSAIRPS